MTQFDLMTRTNDNCITSLTTNSGCCTGGYIGTDTALSSNSITITPGYFYSDSVDTWNSKVIGYISKGIDDMKKSIQNKSVEDKVKIYGKKALEAKCPYCSRPFYVLPEVKEVENYNNRVVLVRFMDDTWTKAVCSENDEFDIDVGITVCILKKIFGGQKEGTRLYNSYLKNVHKKMEANEKAKQEEIEKKKKEREKQRKREMKRKAKQLKAKEEQIDIVKQGFERAIQERDFS